MDPGVCMSRPASTKASCPKCARWRGNGIIARIPDERTEQAVIDAALPTICSCLSENQNRLQESLSLLSNVAFDAAVRFRRLAVTHFVERRFRNFAYIGFDNVGWSRRRGRDCFLRRVAAIGVFLLSRIASRRAPSNRSGRKNSRC